VSKKIPITQNMSFEKMMSSQVVFALPCFFEYLKFFQGRYDTQYTDTCHKDTQSNDNNVTQRKMALGIHCC